MSNILQTRLNTQRAEEIGIQIISSAKRLQHPKNLLLLLDLHRMVFQALTDHLRTLAVLALHITILLEVFFFFRYFTTFFLVMYFFFLANFIGARIPGVGPHVNNFGHFYDVAPHNNSVTVRPILSHNSNYNGSVYGGLNHVPSVEPNYVLHRKEEGNFGLSVRPLAQPAEHTITSPKNVEVSKTNAGMDGATSKEKADEFSGFSKELYVFFFSFFFHHFYHLGAEVFAQKITDPRGPYAELEVLAKTNPILYERRLSSLRDAFSIFPGEVSLYYRYITG